MRLLRLLLKLPILRRVRREHAVRAGPHGRRNLLRHCLRDGERGRQPGRARQRTALHPGKPLPLPSLGHVTRRTQNFHKITENKLSATRQCITHSFDDVPHHGPAHVWGCNPSAIMVAYTGDLGVRVRRRTRCGRGVLIHVEHKGQRSMTGWAQTC